MLKRISLDFIHKMIFSTFILTTFVYVARGLAAQINEDGNYWLKSAQKTLGNVLSRNLNQNIAKNVILFVGDGMGISTLTAARILRGQQKGVTGEENFLEFEKFPNVALIKTYSTDRQVPDSAATATAFYSGIKTKSGVIGYDNIMERGNCSLETSAKKVVTIATRALKAGKAVGVVTTTRITHATPAALFSHSPDRDWECDNKIPDDCTTTKDIARQLIEDSPGKDFKVILGGGRQFFKPSQSVKEKGQRIDQKDLVKIWQDDKKMRNASFAYVDNKHDLLNVDKNTEYLLGLFRSDHMSYSVNRNLTVEPSLTEMTKKAIEVLQKQEEGFLLIVEGGRIDHAHHAGTATKALMETLEFEDAVHETVKMTSENDTLILVTADHSHTMVIGGYPKRGNPIDGRLDTMAQDNLPYTTLLYGNGPGYKVINGMRKDINTVRTQQNYDYNQDAAIPLSEETHAGEDVLLYAKGPMSHLFHSLHEQNYIALAISYASCIDDNKVHCQQKSKSPSARLAFHTSAMFCIFPFIIVKFIL